MDIDIKELIKAAAEGFDLSNFKGDVVGVKIVENEIGNVEEGGIGVQKVYGDIPQNTTEGKPRKKKGSGVKVQKPPKERVIMTFNRKSSVTDGHLSVFFMTLTEDGWIEGNDADFKALFSGKRDADCVLTWTAKYGKGTLVELFKKLAAEGLIIVANGFTIPSILEGHFKDKSGEWLTGLDNGDPVNKKALPVIQECLNILQASVDRLLNGNFDDDEESRSEYDRYDQQDMHWHKK
jgi:hypothetical protein